MNSKTARKLEELRANYEKVVGSKFANFYCPILFRDEDVELCQAHIVNQAFSKSSRSWTIQRKDVDGFYGAHFESDFVNIQYQEKQSPDQVIFDRELTKKLRPQILVAGKSIPYFASKGPIPKHFTKVALDSASGLIELGLKLNPDIALSEMSKGCQIVVEKDIRLPALVSLLKAAHLTLFEMLGYSYALSPGGFLIGSVLGEFFLKSVNRKFESEIDFLRHAKTHFRQFVNLVRPVLLPSMAIQGTLTDKVCFICFCEARIPWALLVFVRTDHLLHAVLMPVFDTPIGAAHFVSFLQSECISIPAHRCRYENNSWQIHSQPEDLSWPKAQLD